MSVPPALLLPNLLADFDEIRELLASPLPTAVSRDLTRVAGPLAALIAITEVGVGEPQAARRWWRTARRAADHAGDSALSAFVRGRQAVMAIYTAHSPRDVLDLADDALAASRGAPCTGAASGLAARAQALALIGEPRPARNALTALAAMFDRLPDEVTRERASPFGWSEQRLHHVESYVSTRLGDTRAAVAAQDRALELYASEQPRGRAQVQLHRAACLVMDGHVTEGVKYATDALELPDGHRDSGLVQGVARATLAAVPDRALTLPPVVEYRELVADP